MSSIATEGSTSSSTSFQHSHYRRHCHHRRRHNRHTHHHHPYHNPNQNQNNASNARVRDSHSMNQRKRNHPRIYIYGPYPQTDSQNEAQIEAQQPIYHSDHIDFDDEDFFGQILDRITIRQNYQNTQSYTRTTKSFIENLPFYKITQKAQDCSICFEEFKSKSKGRMCQLPCEHVFHSGCILPWVYKSNTCPVCRFVLPEETVNGPLNRYVVTIDGKSVEGFGVDMESGFWDAVTRNGLSVRIGLGRFEKEMGSENFGPFWLGENAIETIEAWTYVDCVGPPHD